MSRKTMRCAVPECRHRRDRNEPGEWVIEEHSAKRVWICTSCALIGSAVGS